MDIGFTTYLWLNWALTGLFFGLGYFLASAVYNAIAWVIGQRRASSP
jgi:hypothetical protein